MKGSWRTTSLGIFTIVVALGDAAKLLLDNDVVTNPDWNVVAAAITAGIGLVMARDNRVSSQDVGIRS